MATSIYAILRRPFYHTQEGASFCFIPPFAYTMNGFGEEVNDELSYGILMILRIQYSIDEGMPSEVALVCFLGEFYHLLRRF